MGVRWQDVSAKGIETRQGGGGGTVGWVGRHVSRGAGPHRADPRGTRGSPAPFVAKA